MRQPRTASTPTLAATTTESISELAGLATQLRRSVSHFRLPEAAEEGDGPAAEESADEAPPETDDNALDLDLADAGDADLDMEIDDVIDSDDEVLLDADMTDGGGFSDDGDGASGDDESYVDQRTA